MGRIWICSYNTWQCSRILDSVDYCGTVYFNFIPLGKYNIQTKIIIWTMQLHGEYPMHGDTWLHMGWYGKCKETEGKLPGLIGDTVLPNGCPSRAHLLQVTFRNPLKLQGTQLTPFVRTVFWRSGKNSITTAKTDLGSRKINTWEEEMLGNVQGRAENHFQIILFKTRRAAQ